MSEKYIPTEEEIKKAEDTMTPGQKEQTEKMADLQAEREGLEKVLEELKVQMGVESISVDWGVLHWVYTVKTKNHELKFNHTADGDFLNEMDGDSVHIDWAESQIYGNIPGKVSKKFAPLFDALGNIMSFDKKLKLENGYIMEEVPYGRKPNGLERYVDQQKRREEKLAKARDRVEILKEILG